MSHILPEVSAPRRTRPFGQPVGMRPSQSPRVLISVKPLRSLTHENNQGSRHEPEDAKAQRLNEFADLSRDGDPMRVFLVSRLGFANLKVGRPGRLPADVIGSKS
jgi:hypothetical protein